MAENKIINQAGVDIELCDGTHTIESNIVEAEPIHIRVEKEQSCDRVLVGEKIQYTVKVINECGPEVHDLLFKDALDECTRFVEGSFMVDDHPETPELLVNTLTFVIDTLESCDMVTIAFEVEVTAECCHCNRPEPEQSRTPTTRTTISRFERVIAGTGVRGATVYATFSGDVVRSAVVNLLGAWSIQVPDSLSAGDTIIVVQVEPGKEPSDPVIVKVV